MHAFYGMGESPADIILVVNVANAAVDALKSAPEDAQTKGGYADLLSRADELPSAFSGRAFRLCCDEHLPSGELFEKISRIF